MYYSLNHNKPRAEQTASPTKYPQKFFKDKPCRNCQKLFSPSAPSQLYCSDPCMSEGITTAYLKRTYGISYRDYTRMLKSQNERCAICGSQGFAMDEKRHKLKLVVDHCHTTGKVRGLLCHNCNRALGLFKDSQTSLLTAIEYLKV